MKRTHSLVAKETQSFKIKKKKKKLAPCGPMHSDLSAPIINIFFFLWTEIGIRLMGSPLIIPLSYSADQNQKD